MSDSGAFEEQMRASFAPPPESLEGRTAVVTGASAGIGLAVTLQLLAEGCSVLAIARRAQRLRALEAFVLARGGSLPAPSHGAAGGLLAGGVSAGGHSDGGDSPVPPLRGSLSCLEGDVRDPAFRARLESEGHLRVDAFVCNAGLARGLDPVDRASEEDWTEMIDTNVTAAFSLTRLAVRAMKARGRGHVVGLGSVAGHWAYENGSVYCATKHALRAFFQALRQETCGTGLRVSLVSPGMVRTDFSRVRFHGDAPRADSVYAGAEPLEARDVAALVIHALRQPAHVNLDDIVCMPERQGSPFKVVRKST